MRKILTLAVLRPGRTDAHESASCPGGTSDNSPAFQRRVAPRRGTSPEGTAEIHDSGFSRPSGTWRLLELFPALKRWAVFKCASGTGDGEFKTERGRLVRANPSTGTRGRGVRAPSYGYL